MSSYIEEMKRKLALHFSTQHAAMSASGPAPNVGAEPLAQAVFGWTVLSPQGLVLLGQPHSWL